MKNYKQIILDYKGGFNTNKSFSSVDVMDTEDCRDEDMMNLVPSCFLWSTYDREHHYINLEDIGADRYQIDDNRVIATLSSSISPVADIQVKTWSSSHTMVINGFSV